MLSFVKTQYIVPPFALVPATNLRHRPIIRLIRHLLWHAFFRLCIIPTFQENLTIYCGLTKTQTHLPAKRENLS
jgi:hypothetical protein